MVLASFVAMWALVHQFGFVLDGLRRAPHGHPARGRRRPASPGSRALVTFGPYPAAMVGVPGERRCRTWGRPPLAPVLLGLFQIGSARRGERTPRSLRLATPARPRHGQQLDHAGVRVAPDRVGHLLSRVCAPRRVEVPADPSAALVARNGPAWLLGPLVVTVPLCWFVRSWAGSYDGNCAEPLGSEPRRQPWTSMT